MKNKISIFWFRRDLRWDDNVALYNALKSDFPILPIFIFDVNILNKLDNNDHRVEFIFSCLVKLNDVIKHYNTQINIFHDCPLNVFKNLILSYDVESVYVNKDYEPYAVSRDNQIENFLIEKNISMKKFKDQVIFEEGEILKKDNSPYKVYTPYSRLWLEKFQNLNNQMCNSEKLLINLIKNKHSKISNLEDIGFTKSPIKTHTFDLSNHLINNYNKTRNIPSLNGTSKIGVHLRFGTISIRKLVNQASKFKDITFLKELIWREFFMQILWHYPSTIDEAFKKKYDSINWINNSNDFNMWCNGITGYPIVDAGMRELNKTGFMHNRVRMIAASFLCKHLLIDWRLGEAYFAKKLFDYELSSNIGNWQWVAGCGVDASPYFRIFNPESQMKKFDKDLMYIKKWIPEYSSSSYPEKIIDHNFARERCLQKYREIQ